MTTWETVDESEFYAEQGYYVEDYADDSATVWTVVSD